MSEAIEAFAKLNGWQSLMFFLCLAIFFEFGLKVFINFINFMKGAK